MPNKLLIKANFCDLRNVKEETLAAYDVIEVRANHKKHILRQGK